MSEYTKILLSIVGSVIFGGVIVYFMRHFSIKYFDGVDEQLKTLKLDNEKNLFTLKTDMCKKIEENKIDVKELYKVTREQDEVIVRHDERIKNLEHNSS